MRICICHQFYDGLPGGDGGNSISLPPLRWPQQSREYIASVIAPCYAVTLPDTYSAGQNNVMLGHIMKKKTLLFLFFCSFCALSTGINWIQSADLVCTPVLQAVMSIVKEKREGRREQEMDGQQVVVEESDWVVEEGSELSGSLNMNKLHCCDQIFAPCLYSPLYSV